MQMISHERTVTGEIRTSDGRVALEFEDGLLTVEFNYVSELPTMVVRTEYGVPGEDGDIRQHVFALEQLPELVEHAARILVELIKRKQVRLMAVCAPSRVRKEGDAGHGVL